MTPTAKPHPLLKKIYKELCFPRSLHQLIAEPTKTTERTKTLINHILTNSAEKVIQSGAIEMVLSDHGFIYCTRKTWDKKYADETFVEQLRAIKFPDSSNFTCVNDAH